MTDTTPDGRRVRPFADFLLEHNKGAGHTKAGEALQALVNAVVDTGKSGTVTLTVKVEPMKGATGTLLTTVDVKEKLPVLPLKAAVFYADDEGNLQRTDPNQPAFEGLKDVDALAEKPLKEVPARGEAVAQ